MTDTFKEFYSGSPSYTDLVTGVTLASAGAGVQQVIKEITIQSGMARNFSIHVGGVNVFDRVGHGMLKGAELVPPTKSMVLKTASIALATGMSQIASTTQARTLVVPPIFNDDQFLVTNTSSVVNTTISTTGSVPDFIAFDSGGDFYYGSRGDSNLYRRAGGVTGSQTTNAFVSGPKCWDGVRYIYGLSSGNIYKWDTQTDTLATIAITGTPTPQSFNASYNRLCAIDGYVFHMGNSATTIEIFNGTTGAAVGQITGMINVSTAWCPMEINKDYDGNYILMQIPSSSAILTANLGANLANPQPRVRSNTVPSHAFGTDTTGPVNRLTKNVNAPGILVGFPSSQLLTIFDIVQGSVIKTTQLAGMSDTNFWLTVDSTAANNAFGAVSARAVGVEIT